MKQYSPAFERNREPISGALAEALEGCRRVLEIGSGSGQHVTWFGREFDHIEWIPSELEHNIASVESWRREAGLSNVLEPIALDVLSPAWPAVEVDAMVTINTLHIMPWQATARLFERAAAILPEEGVLFVYGPFRYAGRTLEPSNARFDEWLRQDNPLSGLREFGQVDGIARDNGFHLVEDLAMPANNRSIWWRKAAA